MNQRPLRKSEQLRGPHDVYKADTRSISLPLCPSLQDPEEIPQSTRKEFPIPGSRSFVVENLLTPEECTYLIGALSGFHSQTHRMIYTSDKGWESSDIVHEYPPNYRNNQRLIFISQQMADSLWMRLQSHLRVEGPLE